MPTITIKNRFTGAVLFTTEVDAGDLQPMRTALQRAISADAYLAHANLADANLAGANLARAYLAHADLADAYLAHANLADANLARANLARAYLADANLARANLARANLARADLADANLAGADLADANLAGARNLPAGTEAKDPPTPYVRPLTPPDRLAMRAERARLYREANPSIPVVEDLDRKILSRIEANPACFDMGQWHCNTTHCRAGHAVDIAGTPGYELEKALERSNPGRGSELAGRAIYLASTGRAPYFFGSTEHAVADIRRAVEELDAAKNGGSK